MGFTPPEPPNHWAPNHQLEGGGLVNRFHKCRILLFRCSKWKFLVPFCCHTRGRHQTLEWMLAACRLFCWVARFSPSIWKASPGAERPFPARPSGLGGVPSLQLRLGRAYREDQLCARKGGTKPKGYSGPGPFELQVGTPSAGQGFLICSGCKGTVTIGGDVYPV